MATKVLPAPSAKKMEWSTATILTFARRRRYMTVSIFSWVVIALLTASVMVPQVQKIFERMKSIQEIEDQISQKQTHLSGLQSLNLSELEQANTVLAGALPNEKPVLPLLYSLDRLAIGAQVSVSNFQISPGLLGTESGKVDQDALATAISPNISALPLKMNVAGGFENLSAFFKSLDNVVPFIQVNNIKFQSREKDTKEATTSAQYSADVDLASLYLKRIPSVGETQTIQNLTEGDKALLDKLAIEFAQRESDAQAQAMQSSSSSGRTNLFSNQ